MVVFGTEIVVRRIGFFIIVTLTDAGDVNVVSEI